MSTEILRDRVVPETEKLLAFLGESNHFAIMFRNAIAIEVMFGGVRKVFTERFAGDKAIEIQEGIIILCIQLLGYAPAIPDNWK